MLSKNTILFLFILLSFNPQILFAEDKGLAWQECVQEAAQNNPDLRASSQSVTSSQYEIKANRSDFFPQLTGTANYNVNSSGSSFNNNNNGDTSLSHRQQLEVGVGIKQNLFSGFKTVGSVQRSQALLEDTEANLKLVKSQVSADLKKAFSTLLFFQQQQGVLQKILERRKDNVRFVELRFEAGRENKGSLLRNQASLTQAEFNIAENRRALKVAQRNLAKILGRNYEQNFDQLQVNGNFKTQVPVEPDYAPITEQHPDHQRSVAQVKAAAAEVKVARGDLYPSLDAEALLSRSKEINGNANSFWSAGVNMSYPFATGGRDIYELKASKSEKQKLEEDLKSKDNALTATLKQTYVEFKDAVQRIAVQAEFLKAAQVRAEIARSQYANGLISFQDWDQIENDLIDNEKAILVISRDAKIAEANWELAQGIGAIP